MAQLTNNGEALVIVHGTERYSIPPGKSALVDDETDWESHPYVVCGALSLGDSDDEADESPEESGDSDDEIEGLRREYEDLAGKAADKRWGADKLRAEIEKVLED